MYGVNHDGGDGWDFGGMSEVKADGGTAYDLGGMYGVNPEELVGDFVGCMGLILRSWGLGGVCRVNPDWGAVQGLGGMCGVNPDWEAVWWDVWG